MPIGLAAVVLTALFVPESRAPRSRRLDPVGQVLVIVALASLTYAIIEGPRAGWSSAQTIGTFALSLLALTGVILYEPRRKDPLIDLRFFRSAPFSGATLIAISAFAAFSGFLLINTLYLQDVRGYSPLQAGLCTLPMAAAALVCSPLSGARAQPPRAAAAAVHRRQLHGRERRRADNADAVDAAGAAARVYAVFGIGFGCVNPPITYTAVRACPTTRRAWRPRWPRPAARSGQALGRGGDRLDPRRGGRRRHRHAACLGEPPGVVADRRLRRGVLVLGMRPPTGRWARAQTATPARRRDGSRRKRRRGGRCSRHEAALTTGPARGMRPRRLAPAWLLVGVRYVLPAAIVIAGLVIMALGSENDLEGGASIVSAGLAIYFLNWLFRIGARGDHERRDEDEAREYFQRHGRWPS